MKQEMSAYAAGMRRSGKQFWLMAMLALRQGAALQACSLVRADIRAETGECCR